MFDPDYQRFAAKRLGAKVRVPPTGHFPVRSRPRENAAFIAEAAIVVTSTWRRKMPVPEMVVMFMLYDFEAAPVIGATPELSASAGLSITRGMEGAEWLKVNADGVARYVCLDDDADYLPGRPLVQTDADIGLQDADIAACREKLADRVSGERRLLVRPDLNKGTHVRQWPSGRGK